MNRALRVLMPFRHLVPAQPLMLMLALVALSGCASSQKAIRTCKPDGKLTPHCGYQNPEDLAVLPGDEWLLVSQLERSDGKAGSLAAAPAGGGEPEVLYPMPDDLEADAPPPEIGWGSVDCPGAPDPAKFSPHGIDLLLLPDGNARLVVVNHGGRESIEFFAVSWGEGRPELAWRGCVLLPPATQGNDVVALQDGGLMVTNPAEPAEGMKLYGQMVKLMFRRPTGTVLEWHAEGGWKELPGSRLSMPNGIASSPDGATVFVTAWGGKRIYRFDRNAPGAPASQKVATHPDNLSWLADGRLVLAGQNGSMFSALPCIELTDGTCPMAFSVLAVNPKTLEIETLLSYDGEATGAVSAAVQRSGELYLGTFAGDRITRMPFSP